MRFAGGDTRRKGGNTHPLPCRCGAACIGAVPGGDKRASTRLDPRVSCWGAGAMRGRKGSVRAPDITALALSVDGGFWSGRGGPRSSLCVLGVPGAQTWKKLREGKEATATARDRRRAHYAATICDRPFFHAARSRVTHVSLSFCYFTLCRYWSLPQSKTLMSSRWRMIFNFLFGTPHIVSLVLALCD
jgi:hypothetical protein